MLGFPILYLKGMRAIMFQLSGFYCILISTKSGTQGIVLVVIDSAQNYLSRGLVVVWVSTLDP